MLKKIIIIYTILLFSSCKNMHSDGFLSINENMQKNEIYLNYNYNGKTEIIKVFNYIPSTNKLYIKYPNGSILGFFPIKDETVKIKAWNDKKHNFALIYCNSKTKKIINLSTGRGWDYHIIDSEENNKKWVARTPKGNAEIFLIDDKGLISNQIFFQTEISPDVVSLKKNTNGETFIILESMDYYREYLLDFVSKRAELITNK